MLRAWARSGRAAGWLSVYVDRHADSMPSEPVIRTLRNGLRMSLNRRDLVQRRIYFFGAYEPIELSLFLDFIDPGATVIDAGANVGFHSLMLGAQVGLGGRVVSFEPVPTTYAALVANVELNALSQVEPVHAALWNSRDDIQLGLQEKDRDNVGGYSFAVTDASSPAMVSVGIPLDEFIAERGIERVDAVKMDIEGAEWFALEGARRTIERDLPVFLLEVCRSTCALAGYDVNRLWSEFFELLGYRAYLPAKRAWIETFEGIDQYNVILVHPSRERPIGDWDEKALLRQFL